MSNNTMSQREIDLTNGLIDLATKTGATDEEAATAGVALVVGATMGLLGYNDSSDPELYAAVAAEVQDALEKAVLKFIGEK